MSHAPAFLPSFPFFSRTPAHANATPLKYAPSVLALATAAVLATGAAHPRLLTPRLKRVAVPAAAVALAVGGLARPRQRKWRRAEEMRGVGQVEEGSEKGVEGGLLFEASRREWEAEDKLERENGSSGVYSYSFKRSRKSVQERHRENETDGRGVFGHMREEFERENVGEDDGRVEDWRVRDDALEWDDEEDEDEAEQGTAEKEQQNVNREVKVYEEKLPGAMSMAVLLRTLARVPLWLIREVVVPIADGVALAWYDAKILILARGKKGRERYLFAELKGRTSNEEGGWESTGEVLTEEERQIREVGRAAETVIRGFQGGVRRLLRKLL